MTVSYAVLNQSSWFRKIVGRGIGMPADHAVAGWRFAADLESPHMRIVQCSSGTPIRRVIGEFGVIDQNGKQLPDALYWSGWHRRDGIRRQLTLYLLDSLWSGTVDGAEAPDRSGW